MDDGNSIPFSAFLAGALLTKERISKIELIDNIGKFEEENNKYIDNRILYKIDEIVKEDNNDFYLIRNYNDVYDNRRTIRDYLYSMTTSEVKKFFGLTESQNINCGYNVIKTNIFKKIRTRVFS